MAFEYHVSRMKFMSLFESVLIGYSMKQVSSLANGDLIQYCSGT